MAAHGEALNTRIIFGQSGMPGGHFYLTAYSENIGKWVSVHFTETNIILRYDGANKWVK